MKFAAILLALLFTSQVGDDSEKKDRDLMQGEWVVPACHVSKVEVTSPDGEHLITFVKDKWRVTRNGKQGADGVTFTLDAGKPFRTFDFKMGEQEYEGIYELKGDVLRICYSKERPTKFDAEEHEQAPFNVLFELKRK
jgi:uncharacterized protein (TIGR03067 family)